MKTCLLVFIPALGDCVSSSSSSPESSESGGFGTFLGRLNVFFLLNGELEDSRACAAASKRQH